MKKTSEYRQHAEECRQMMAAASAAEQKAMLEKMAQTWENLAHNRERRATQQTRIAELEKSKKTNDS